MAHITAEAAQPTGATTPWSVTPGWRVRTLRGWMSPDDIARTSGPRITLAVGALCVLLGLTVVWKGDVNETAAGFFPPAGASFVALVVLPARRWGWALAGILVPTAIGLAFSLAPASSTLVWGLANCVEPALAVALLRRVPSAQLRTPARTMAAFLACAVVVGPVAGATIGTFGTNLGYDSAGIASWAEWAIGDGLGVLVVSPLLLSHARRQGVPRGRPEIVGFVVLVGVATGLAFAEIGSDGAALLPYLILVGLIWAGMRFGRAAAAGAGFVVALGANIATALDVGPFAAGNGAIDVITLQIFLVIALVASFVVAAMASEMAGRAEVHRLLTHQATHDALTGLPNRSLFNERLSEALVGRTTTACGVAVILIDLDDFKKINDRHGHPAGDAALVAIGRLMTDSVRPQDVLARLGGDEFVALCSDLTHADQVMPIALQMTRSLDRPVDVDGVEYRIAASVGVAFVGAATDVGTSDLLRRADIALHHSKRTGGTAGGRVSLFDAALEATTRRRAEMDIELQDAIERGELSVAYQPIVDLTTGEISEFEALARWDNRRFGVVGPDEFIALAEQIGLVTRIGDWILEQACRQTAAWRSAPLDPRHADVTISVNASARQLCDEAYPERVRRILSTSGLPPEALTIEITETAVMDDLEASASVLAALRSLGVTLSMDDFGTGYSSMTNLRRIPLQTLKIDRSFVAGLGTVREDTAIVESLVTLGHSCGLHVVAEGIETTSQLEQLLELGCDYGQGYLWSKPVEAAAAAELLGPTWSRARLASLARSAR